MIRDFLVESTQINHGFIVGIFKRFLSGNTKHSERSGTVGRGLDWGSKGCLFDSPESLLCA